MADDMSHLEVLMQARLNVGAERMIHANTRPRYNYVQARHGYDGWGPARYDIEDSERVTSAHKGEFRAIAREVLLEDARRITEALNRAHAP